MWRCWLLLMCLGTGLVSAVRDIHNDADAMPGACDGAWCNSGAMAAAGLAQPALPAPKNDDCETVHVHPLSLSLPGACRVAGLRL
jgi:hypothetical protein